MQEISHHGRIIQEYRELKAGITQEELRGVLAKVGEQSLHWNKRRVLAT